MQKNEWYIVRSRMVQLLQAIVVDIEMDLKEYRASSLLLRVLHAIVKETK